MKKYIALVILSLLGPFFLTGLFHLFREWPHMSPLAKAMPIVLLLAEAIRGIRRGEFSFRAAAYKVPLFTSAFSALRMITLIQYFVLSLGFAYDFTFSNEAVNPTTIQSGATVMLLLGFIGLLVSDIALYLFQLRWARWLHLGSIFLYVLLPSLFLEGAGLSFDRISLLLSGAILALTFHSNALEGRKEEPNQSPDRTPASGVGQL